ncbi:DUF418 domain-containing protein [Natronospirillum operosum]|uniref:DUF418 domain-containing protein n=2 Tax=Natronospirillum operosum TaxID=2759953 RepID=A0A4Z0W9V3_9GAMM|nr:DUF418 domain-containing protein [Natronospirillum operosum]
MLLLIAMAYAPMYLSQPDVGGYGVIPGGGLADQIASFAAALLLENRAFPMFAILFGYGMVMLVNRQQAAGTAEKDARGLLRRRALWLIVFGMVHATLVFPGEILTAYGLGTLILGWLLFRADSTIKRAVALLVPFSIVMAVLGSVLMTSDEGSGFVIPGYMTMEDWIVRLVGALIGPLFSSFVFPLLILVTIGMWLGRIGLLDDLSLHRRTLRWLTVVGIAISVLGALPLALAGTGVLSSTSFALGLMLALQIITGIAGGVGYIAAFGLIGLHLEQRRRTGILTRALVAAGRRSLTIYLMVSAGVAIVLHPDLLGLGEYMHRAGAMGVAVVVWTASVAFALWLDTTGKRGPADALLRRLVYR